MIYTWLIVAGVVLLSGIVFVFNSLVVKRNRVNNAWSDIDVQLKRRYDLVPNLVETVKGYKGYEASVLENVTKSRAGVLDSAGVANRAQAESILTGALKNFFVAVENYPELRASESFRKLQNELSVLENDIQSARRYYNAAVRELNNGVQSFPANIVAGVFKFKQSEFFGAEEGERGVVKVSL